MVRARMKAKTSMIDHAAIIIEQDDKVLFIRRALTKKTLPGIWSFPSGTQESGESIFETARREALEEFGIDVAPHATLAVTELPEFQVRLHFVRCALTGGVPEILDYGEMSELRWLTFDEFFAMFTDEEIGHGLIWLRPQANLWRD